MLLAALVSFAFLLLLLLLAGKHNQEAALRDWEIILNPEGSEVYDHVSKEIAFNYTKVRVSYTDAARARADGNMDEALRYLAIGSRVVGECSEDLVGLLRNIWNISRHASAIAPMPPLRPAGFRARELATLAGLHQVAHHLLMTTRERLYMRLAVLRCGVRAAGFLLLRATWRTREHPEKGQGWRRMDVLRADLGTLTDESLGSLRAVLASLAAVRRPAAEAEAKRPA